MTTTCPIKKLAKQGKGDLQRTLWELDAILNQLCQLLQQGRRGELRPPVFPAG